MNQSRRKKVGGFGAAKRKDKQQNSEVDFMWFLAEQACKTNEVKNNRKVSELKYK